MVQEQVTVNCQSVSSSAILHGTRAGDGQLSECFFISHSAWYKSRGRSTVRVFLHQPFCMVQEQATVNCQSVSASAILLAQKRRTTDRQTTVRTFLYHWYHEILHSRSIRHYQTLPQHQGGFADPFCILNDQATNLQAVVKMFLHYPHSMIRDSQI